MRKSPRSANFRPFHFQPKKAREIDLSACNSFAKSKAPYQLTNDSTEQIDFPTNETLCEIVTSLRLVRSAPACTRHETIFIEDIRSALLISSY